LPKYDPNDPLYHKYDVEHGICSAGASGCTTASVFDSLRRNAAPGADGVTTIRTGDKTTINFLGIDGGTVVHVVDEKGLQIINITLDDHVFESGYVIRSVVERDGVIYVRSFGEGINRPAPEYHSPLTPTLNTITNGGSWLLNQATYGPGWWYMDRKIQQDVMKGQ